MLPGGFGVPTTGLVYPQRPEYPSCSQRWAAGRHRPAPTGNWMATSRCASVAEATVTFTPSRAIACRRVGNCQDPGGGAGRGRGRGL